MSGSLTKIGTSTASGNPTTLTITGIDTTFNVYLVTAVGLIPSSDNTIAWRITKSGTIQTDSEYDNSRLDMPTHSSFQNNEALNATSVTQAEIESTDSGFFGNFYLFNFANTGEYSFATFETVCSASTPSTFGGNGAFTHTVASASDGLSFFFTGGATFNNGAELVLYGLRK